MGKNEQSGEMLTDENSTTEKFDRILTCLLNHRVLDNNSGKTSENQSSDKRALKRS
jgi:hypothetical protein